MYPMIHKLKDMKFWY